MRNARLDESQVGIKIARGNINNLRCSDDTGRKGRGTKELLEESEKPGLNSAFEKAKIMASSPITSWHIEGGQVEAATDFIFLGSRITLDSDCSHEIEGLEEKSCSLEEKL